MEEKPNLITARQLAERLMKFGDLPVRLRVVLDTHYHHSDRPVTMIEERALQIDAKAAQDTEWGDMDVCRLTVEIIDNA